MVLTCCCFAFIVCQLNNVHFFKMLHLRWDKDEVHYLNLRLKLVGGAGVFRIVGIQVSFHEDLPSLKINFAYLT